MTDLSSLLPSAKRLPHFLPPTNLDGTNYITIKYHTDQNDRVAYITLNRPKCYMSLSRSYKPTISMVHGFAIAGGSDIALCCDMVMMEENAKIGYPPGRLWGSPTTHMWSTRIGVEQSKRMLLTGDVINGTEA